jgi:hypothetical protein
VALMRVLAIAALCLLLAACAGDGSPRADYCYKTIRAPGGKGPRALAAAPCAAQQQSESERPPEGLEGTTPTATATAG